MYWQLRMMDDIGEAQPSSGRFAMHRTTDGQIDLRIEMDGYLMGWRVEGDSLADAAWATEKSPHPVDWIDVEAGRIDHGTYTWIDRGDDRRALVLRGANTSHAVAFEPVALFTTRQARAIANTLAAIEADVNDAPSLIADGAVARRRAVARFTGLGRELDGDAFDSTVWTRALTHLSLDEIHRQLGALEARFDAKYPPVPTSVAEALDTNPEVNTDALEILRS